MAKVTNLFYITILFLSLFFIAMNDAARYECREDSHCVTKVKCGLPRTPKCRNYICFCHNPNKYI
ncbi:Nodule Cysteine-Rich (NCR) secreted peptide [Medicago truncatula]|uniref:Nodule Cysteine-Rich (NCR) secreted peptide n=2 Tax=Medicago truncatula TaxID=3880 RepID=A0A072TR97_MEDTR|nr:Nodule Cysteine-Rich (NCR) secreted peptide [Medicago truncatula]